MIRLQSSSVPLTESMKREDMKREDDDPMRDSPRGKSRQTADMTGTGLRLELIGMTPPRVPLVSWGLLVLTGVYFLAGKFGLSLAFVHASASAVWPPGGGRRPWGWGGRGGGRGGGRSGSGGGWGRWRGRWWWRRC